MEYPAFPNPIVQKHSTRGDDFMSNGQETTDYIEYRLLKSGEAFKDAKLLATNQRWNASINRLYYACFYAVSALPAKHNVFTHTHSGCKSQFGLHFIKTGLIDAEQGKLYADLMDWRQKGDYGDMFDFDKETVEPLFEKVNRFLEGLKLLMQRNSSSFRQPDE
jgi:uncharacterized protein (UPF0332 family)